jgi:hypothetical protein
MLLIDFTPEMVPLGIALVVILLVTVVGIISCVDPNEISSWRRELRLTERKPVLPSVAPRRLASVTSLHR